MSELAGDVHPFTGSRRSSTINCVINTPARRPSLLTPAPFGGGDARGYDLAPMFARLTTTVIGANEPEAAAAIVENVLPTLKGLAGFKGLVVLEDATTRVLVGMTLWESADSMERSEPVTGGIRRAETTSRDVVRHETNTFRVAAFYLP